MASHKELFEEGVKAFFEKTQCPYDGIKQTWEWDVWHEGFEHAFEWEIRMQDKIIMFIAWLAGGYLLFITIMSLLFH